MSKTKTKLKDTVYVMFYTTENRVLRKEFEYEEDLEEFIGSSMWFINKALEKKSIKGGEYKSNMFNKTIDDKSYIKHIIVYKNDWESYSIRKRKNRLNKLTNQ